MKSEISQKLLTFNSHAAINAGRTNVPKHNAQLLSQN